MYRANASDVKNIDESTMVPVVEPTQTVESVVEDSLAEPAATAPEDSKVEESSD